MTKNITSFLIASLFLIPAWVFASETRVNSTGGLSLVMTDETVDINPFTFGNPAGLSLLPPQSRFDVATPWFQETPATNPAGQVQAYGFLPQLVGIFSTPSLLTASNSTLKYQGLILFPTSQWAFQAGGNLLHATNQFDSTINNLDSSLDNSRGMARTAYNFGPFSLGTQMDIEQVNKSLPSTYPGGPDGQGSSSLLTSTSGLMINFQLDDDKKNPAYLRIGGEYALQLPPAQEKDTFYLNFSGNPFTLDYLYQSQSFTTFGPEVYLDIPDSFQAAVITRFSQSVLNFQFNSSDQTLVSSVPSFKLDNASGSAVVGLFKGKLPLAGTLRQKLSVNTGGYLLVGGSQTTTYDTTGKTYQDSTGNDLQAGVGVGVENSKDFTVGLQASMESQAGSTTITGGSSNALSYFAYTVSVGGERWLNPHWAFRAGISFEDDFNAGSTLVQRPYYTLGTGDRVATTTLTTGLGFEESFFRSDFMFWTGQPSLYNSPNPNAFATQVGAELSVSILFD